MDQPDERRTPDKTTVDVVKIGGQTLLRTRFEPGWRWSECVQPVVGGDSCQVHHIGYVISGSITVAVEGAGEVEVGAGSAYEIPPGHDAWVVGNEPFVGLEVSPEAANYAKPK